MSYILKDNDSQGITGYGREGLEYLPDGRVRFSFNGIPIIYDPAGRNVGINVSARSKWWYSNAIPVLPAVVAPIINLPPPPEPDPVPPPPPPAPLPPKPVNHVYDTFIDEYPNISVGGNFNGSLIVNIAIRHLEGDGTLDGIASKTLPFIGAHFSDLETYLVTYPAPEILDVTHTLITIKLNLFSWVEDTGTELIVHTIKYPRSVYLDSIEPVCVDDNGFPTSNAYASVIRPNGGTGPTLVYQVDTEGNPTEVFNTDVEEYWHVEIRDLACLNKALRYNFIDTAGVSFSHISQSVDLLVGDNDTLWDAEGIDDTVPFIGGKKGIYISDRPYEQSNWNYPATSILDTNYPSYKYSHTPDGDVHKYVTLPSPIPQWIPQRALFELPSGTIAPPDYYLIGSTPWSCNQLEGTHTVMHFSVVGSLPYDSQKTRNGASVTASYNALGMYITPFTGAPYGYPVTSYTAVTGLNRANYVTLGMATSLNTSILYNSDIGYLNHLITISGGTGVYKTASTAIDIMYGVDSCFYIGASIAEDTIDTDFDPLDADFTLTYYYNISPLYFSGGTTKGIRTAMAKVARYNVPYTGAFANALADSNGVAVPNNPQDIVPRFKGFMLSDHKTRFDTLPTITFNVLPNPKEFTWLETTPSGLHAPLSSYSFGACSTGSSLSKIITFRITAPNKEYHITSISVTSITNVPVQTLAEHLPTFSTDFTISSEWGTSYAPLKTISSQSIDSIMPSLSDFEAITVTFAPQLKLVSTMTVPIQSAGLIAGANVRRLKIQVYGYDLSSGNTTPIALGDPLLITGSVI